VASWHCACCEFGACIRGRCPLCKWDSSQLRRRMPARAPTPPEAAAQSRCLVHRGSSVLAHTHPTPGKKAGRSAWDSHLGPLVTFGGRQWGFSCQSAVEIGAEFNLLVIHHDRDSLLNAGKATVRLAVGPRERSSPWRGRDA
jgi:hypothetical protein